jgi:hypothetical protein
LSEKDWKEEGCLFYDVYKACGKLAGKISYVYSMRKAVSDSRQNDIPQPARLVEVELFHKPRTE